MCVCVCVRCQMTENDECVYSVDILKMVTVKADLILIDLISKNGL